VYPKDGLKCLQDQLDQAKTKWKETKEQFATMKPKDPKYKEVETENPFEHQPNLKGFFGVCRRYT
jgi:hypothetical protein